MHAWNKEHAANWLFEQGDNWDQAVADVWTGPRLQLAPAAPRPRRRPAYTELKGLVAHRPERGCGRYVAHIREKDGRWAFLTTKKVTNKPGQLAIYVCTRVLVARRRKLGCFLFLRRTGVALGDASAYVTVPLRAEPHVMFFPFLVSLQVASVQPQSRPSIELITRSTVTLSLAPSRAQVLTAATTLLRAPPA